MKKVSNKTGVKVKFLGMTKNREPRIKITEMNSKKSKTFELPDNMTELEYAFSLLDTVEVVKEYCVMVDNTQQDYFIILVETHHNYFTDIVSGIKV